MCSVPITELVTKGTQFKFVIRHVFTRLFHFQHEQIVFIRVPFVDKNVREHSSCSQLTI